MEVCADCQQSVTRVTKVNFGHHDYVWELHYVIKLGPGFSNYVLINDRPDRSKRRTWGVYK